MNSKIFSFNSRAAKNKTHCENLTHTARISTRASTSVMHFRVRETKQKDFRFSVLTDCYSTLTSHRKLQFFLFCQFSSFFFSSPMSFPDSDSTDI